MSKETWDRLAAGAGLFSVAIFVVAGLIYGNPPNVDEQAAAVVEFFTDNRDQVLWAVFLQGFGVLALIWFMAALIMAMRAAGELLLAIAAGLAFALALALGSFATLIRAGLAFTVADDADSGTVAGLFHFSALVDTSQNIVSAGFYLPVAVVVLRTGFLPRWWGWVSAIVGAWAVVSATAWSRDGFWSPDGAGFITFGIYVVWVGATSVLLLLRTRQSAA